MLDVSCPLNTSIYTMITHLGERREAVKGENVAPPDHTSFAIQALTLKYKGAASGATPHEISWSRPVPGIYEANIDACFFPNGTGASGIVIRNDRGEAIAGAGDPFNNLLDVTMSEATTLRRGLQLIDDHGCVPVIVEIDSLELVESFNGVIEIWSPYTAILMDYFQLAQRIGRVTIQP